MFGFGIGELLIVLTLVLLVFYRRLPDLGGSFGAAIKRFKKALNEPDEIDITPVDETAKRHEKK
jgi:sec-independent protein translocase protein TatA